MGPRSDNRGYGRREVGEEMYCPASMGPRSDNRGYVTTCDGVRQRTTELQWVHGPITVVMEYKDAARAQFGWLQWVHGPITVVMGGLDELRCPEYLASMGPRSDNRGYAHATNGSAGGRHRLQWVHGPITVVMLVPPYRPL